MLSAALLSLKIFLLHFDIYFEGVDSMPVERSKNNLQESVLFFYGAEGFELWSEGIELWSSGLVRHPDC